jgi:hypothetical protein
LNILLREVNCVASEFDFDVTAAVVVDAGTTDAANAIAIASIVNMVVEFCIADNIVT